MNEKFFDLKKEKQDRMINAEGEKRLPEIQDSV